jgi:hypothetical protein
MIYAIQVKNCLSARYDLVAKVVCRDIDVFGTRSVSLNRILYWYYLRYYNTDSIRDEYICIYYFPELIVVGVTEFIEFLLLTT